MTNENKSTGNPSSSPWVELFDEHTMASDNFRWASALFEGIELAMEKKRHHAAVGMAELGRYFADNWISHHETEADKVKQATTRDSNESN